MGMVCTIQFMKYLPLTSSIFGFEGSEQILHIFQNHVAARDEEQGDDRCEEYSETEADSHWNQELSLEASFQDHR